MGNSCRIITTKELFDEMGWNKQPGVYSFTAVAAKSGRQQSEKEEKCTAVASNQLSLL